MKNIKIAIWAIPALLKFMTAETPQNHESHDRFPLPLTLLPRGEKGVS
jgi:hypothetical protein